MIRAAVFLLSSAAAAFAGPAYSVAAIQPPGGLTSVQMFGINTSGQVASSGLDSNDIVQSFIGSPSGSTMFRCPLALNWLRTPLMTPAKLRVQSPHCTEWVSYGPLSVALRASR